jgi:hypothetical protein
LHQNNKNNNKDSGKKLLAVPRIYISVVLQQNTANFEEAFGGGVMQWSFFSEEKHKNQLAQSKICFTTA